MSELILAAVPYTLALLVPAIVLSYIAGNRVGALAARRKTLDNTVLPASYILTATPYMWLALVLAYVFAFRLQIFPVSGAYDFSLQPEWSWEFARSFASHWVLPFLSLFLVAFGGWAIGMRNLIIYELEADYANYLQSLGAPQRLVRRYAYRNAILPQMSGLALALGAVVGGALVTEIVFGYPGRRLAHPDGGAEPRLLPAPGHLPLHHHRRPDRELHRRHRLRDRRSAHARRHPGVVDDRHRARSGATRRHARRAVGVPPLRRRRSEALYFALRNRKLLIGLGVVVAMLVLAIIGPWLTDADPFEFGYGVGEPPSRSTGSGRRACGQDVYAQFVYGLRSSFLVGALAAVIASVIGMTVGFIAGYRGGVVDEILSMFTNVVLVIPTLAVLIIVATYLSVRGLVIEAILIGATAWPWAARAIRAQTFSLVPATSSASPACPARAGRT